MSEDQTENPSIHETNKAVRVLTGKPLKFTVRIQKADGSVIEYQSDNCPKLDYDNEARGLWIKDGSYNAAPVMAHEPGMVVLCEENPKP